MTNALQWRLSEVGGADPGSSFAALPTVRTDVTTGHAQTSDAGADGKVGYRQQTSFDDDVLAGGLDYRLLITYTALQGI